MFVDTQGSDDLPDRTRPPGEITPSVTARRSPQRLRLPIIGRRTCANRDAEAIANEPMFDGANPERRADCGTRRDPLSWCQGKKQQLVDFTKWSLLGYLSRRPQMCLLAKQALAFVATMTVSGTIPTCDEGLPSSGMVVAEGVALKRCAESRVTTARHGSGHAGRQRCGLRAILRRIRWRTNVRCRHRLAGLNVGFSVCHISIESAGLQGERSHRGERYGEDSDQALHGNSFHSNSSSNCASACSVSCRTSTALDACRLKGVTPSRDLSHSRFTGRGFLVATTFLIAGRGGMPFPIGRMWVPGRLEYASGSAWLVTASQHASPSLT